MSETRPDPAAATSPAPAATSSPAPAATTTPPAAVDTGLPQPDGNLIADPPAAAVEPDKPVDPNAPKPEDKPAVEPLDPKAYKLDMPEGLTADNPLVVSLTETVAKLGVSNDVVQAIISELGPKVNTSLIAPYQAWADLQNQWQAESKADPDFGGPKLIETQARLRAGIETFSGGDGTPEGNKKAIAAVDEALRVTGAGNNPAIIRLLNNAFSRLVEGTPVMGSPVNPPKSPAAALYDNPSSRTAASA